MIISRTPLRISFAGGGSDIQAYYRKEFGAITSIAINKYVYITVNKKFDNSIRVCYSRLEQVERIDQIKHNLVREAMKLSGVTKSIEITSVADIPSKGTGLGSSSAFVVGLLNALYAYKGKKVSAKELAEQACYIETQILKEPIGKQDQYICAFGGIRHIRFYPDEKVTAKKIICPKKTIRTLKTNLMLFYTGISRDANSILDEQHKRTKSGLNFDSLTIMKNLAIELKHCLETGIDSRSLGEFLHKNWLEKKRLCADISNEIIDRYYQKAIEAGVSGGKLLGAGKGGFLLFVCPERFQHRLRRALQGLREMSFGLEAEGSKIIFGG